MEPLKGPEPLTERARHQYLSFQERYQAQLARARSEVSLSILVWGPSLCVDSVVSRKRIEIRDALRRDGHSAAFSEELECSEPYTSLKSVELAQARTADLIIILLESSPGAVAETHDFADRPELVGKCYIFVPVAYRSGYSSRGILKDIEEGYGGVYWYEPDELRACDVLSRALKRAEARRQIEFRARTL